MDPPTITQRVGRIVLAAQHAGRVGCPSVAATLIKKYGNRRLYDTGESRYVTLEELAAKVRGGTDVRVVDAQTAEDLTQSTLVQIVLETGNAAKFLPTQLLMQMIRLSDDALAEFFSRYVTGALDMYLQAKRGVQTLATYNPLTQWFSPFASYAASPTGPAYSVTPTGPIHVAPPPPPEEPPARGGNEEVAAMRGELDELKQMLRESLQTKKKKKKS